MQLTNRVIWVKLLVLALVAVDSGILIGCRSVAFEPAPERRPLGSVVRVDGDWDDLDAAVEVAAGANQLAVVRRVEVGAWERMYELVTVTDKAVVISARVVDESLTIAVEEESAKRESVTIELTCRYGHAGDAGRESTVLRSVVRRLSQLRGRDFAPLHAPVR